MKKYLKKLPMSLIHEGVGEVVYDHKGIFKIGTKVVLVPNTPVEKINLLEKIICHQVNSDQVDLMDLCRIMYLWIMIE